jgi:hypothetical protein
MLQARDRAVRRSSAKFDYSRPRESAGRRDSNTRASRITCSEFAVFEGTGRGATLALDARSTGMVLAHLQALTE